MGNVYGVNYTLAFQTTPPSAVVANEYGGKLYRYYDSYEASGLAADEVIYLCKPPKGSKMTGLSKIHFDDLGTGATMHVGIPTDTDKFKASIDVSTAAGSAFLDLIDGINYEFDGDTPVVAEPKSAAISGTIKLELVVSQT